MTPTTRTCATAFTADGEPVGHEAREVRDVVEQPRHELARLVALDVAEPKGLVRPEQIEAQPVEGLAVEQRRARAPDEREDRLQIGQDGEHDRGLHDRSRVARRHRDVEHLLHHDGQHPLEGQPDEQAHRDDDRVLAVGPRVGPQHPKELEPRSRPQVRVFGGLGSAHAPRCGPGKWRPRSYESPESRGKPASWPELDEV